MSNLIEVSVKTLSQLMYISETVDVYYQKLSLNALKKASQGQVDSHEYHKWMGVHHRAAAIKAYNNQAKDDEKFHDTQHQVHADHVKEDAWHNGDTHHWKGF